ncbi:MAG: ATP-binding protein [Chloroflexi bacterium]|nr:ATP-binding protein [Chloroflexota bacterium]
MANPVQASGQSPYEAFQAARRARIVVNLANISFYASIALVIVVAAMLLMDYSKQLLIAWFLLLISPGLNLVIRQLARTGRGELAGYLFVAYYMLVIALNTSTIANISPILAPGLLLVAAIGGLVLPAPHSFVVAGLGAATYIVATAAIRTGVEVASLSLPLAQAFDMVVIVSAMLFMSLVSYYVTSDLRKALDEATFDVVEANQKLAKASEMKSQFTARTSHELRTPLSAIIAFTDLALHDTYGVLPPKLREALTHVFTSSRHLKVIINDLLDLSKIEAGQLDVGAEPFALAKLVETVESTSAPMAAEKGLKWDLQVDPKMPATLIGDVERISQILVNLAGNAVKFTEKGEVSVRIEPQGTDRWRIQVRDTGLGIPESQREAIFEAYRQLGNGAANARTGGTGLGLAITRHLVRLMGGTIRVESTFGKGSTFTVELPLKSPVAIA